MTGTASNSDDLRAKRARLIHQLRQLAAKMENKELDQTVWSTGAQDDHEQYRIMQYKIQAGKIIFELHRSGECPDGPLCQIIGHWSRMPFPESEEWNYVQGFDSICWQRYGDRFADLKIILGELRACAFVIRLLIGVYEHQDID